jgi:outer membrane protein TolC
MVAVPNRPLTLKDCISLALNESPALEATRLDLTSVTEQARAAHAELLPDITGRASYQLFSGSPTNKFAVIDVGGGIGVGTGRNVDQGAVEIYSAHLAYPLFRDGSIFGLNTAPAEASRLAKR